MMKWLLVICAIAGCDRASFRDCAVACNAETGCPDGFACGAEGLCRAEGARASCVDVIADAGTDADESCRCTDSNTLTCGSGSTTCALGCDSTVSPARCHDVAASNGIDISPLDS